MATTILQKGSILIAHPQMEDDFFEKKVILLVEYNSNGALGFILNNEPSHTIADATDDFGTDTKFPIYNAGPVGEFDIHFVHTKPNLIGNGVDLGNGLFWNGKNEDVIAALHKRVITEKELKFFHGYCGWDEGLLEQEIAEQSWIVCKANIGLVMNNDTNKIWDECLELIEYKI